MNDVPEAHCTEITASAHRFEINSDGKPLSYADVLRLWQTDDEFRNFFIGLLSASPFEAYRWETPAITTVTAPEVQFEFVLHHSPGLERRVDSKTFSPYFGAETHGIVTFENKGRDATLVVPTPRGPNQCYGHLATFIRSAPQDQVHALWQRVGEKMEERLSAAPLWLSTAGAGVSWLHVRLDSRPKYYWYAPYREGERFDRSLER